MYVHSWVNVKECKIILNCLGESDLFIFNTVWKTWLGTETDISCLNIYVIFTRIDSQRLFGEHST